MKDLLDNKKKAYFLLTSLYICRFEHTIEWYMIGLENGCLFIFISTSHASTKDNPAESKNKWMYEYKETKIEICLNS